MTLNEIRDIMGRIRPKELKLLQNELMRDIEAGRYSADEALSDGLLKGMEIVGQRFKDGEIFLPEVMLSAKIMKDCVDKLKPFLAAKSEESRGSAVIGTVKGDNHDIGKNLVKIMLEGRGIRVLDLGTDVPPERFVEAALSEGASLICASALLTTTMPVMAEIVDAAKEKGLKVMIGGAPVTAEFAVKIGADAYEPDAAAAADRAVRLIAGQT